MTKGPVSTEVTLEIAPGICWSRDGKSLPDSEGPLALVSLNDTRPGPRHVKWPRTIEVLLVSD